MRSRRNESGNITGIRFTAEEGKTNTGEYTITYRTKAEPSWNSREVKNTATFRPGDGSAQISTTGTVWISGGEIAKAVGSAEESADGTTMVLPWKVTLTVPESGILSGTSIVDDPTKNQWGGAGGTHYLTKEQVQAWTEGIYWADAEENRDCNGFGFGDCRDQLPGIGREKLYAKRDSESHNRECRFINLHNL